MNAHTERLQIAGPAGPLELAIDHPAGEPIGTVVGPNDAADADETQRGEPR